MYLFVPLVYFINDLFIYSYITNVGIEIEINVKLSGVAHTPKGVPSHNSKRYF